MAEVTMCNTRSWLSAGEEDEVAEHAHASPTPRAARMAAPIVLARAADRWERGAHDAAHLVSAPSAVPARLRVQPVAAWADDEATVAPASVGTVLGERGTPLEQGVRYDFERRFGHDFSRVRVHAGSAAAQSAREVGARAYTVGHDIVFGAGQYEPSAPSGRAVLAHELAHVIQQDGTGGHGVARLQRLSASDFVEVAAEMALGPAGRTIAHEHRQYIDDLAASVRESPQHFGKFFKDELLTQILPHLPKIIAVTALLIGAEFAVAALAAAPEPTLLSKVIAAILQILIIAFLAYTAAVEVKGAYEEGRRWLAIAREAEGQPAKISEASDAFVRMVWHIFLAVLAVAGVRARIGGLTGEVAAAGEGAVGGEASAGGEAGAAGTGGASAQGGEVIPIRPRFQAQAKPPPTQPRASAFEGSAARKIAPAEEPLPEPAPTAPAAPAPAPAPSATVSTAVKPRPRVQVVPAVAAGVSQATKRPRQRPPFVLRVPVEKAPHIGKYRNLLGVLQSDPKYVRPPAAQRDKWHQEHRSGGGAHAIPAKIYLRGHALGLTGEAGEMRIRVPDWTWTRGPRVYRPGAAKVNMEVDHIVELQLLPNRPWARETFDSVDYYELLTKTANVASRNRIFADVARERAIQEAFDPSKIGQVLVFDRVEPGGGQPAERWTSEEVRRGEQLDAYS